MSPRLSHNTPELAELLPWLREAVVQHFPPISKGLLFGSILTSGSPNDIDLILISDEWDIRAALTNLRYSFRRRFGLNLHIQSFHVSQTVEIESFLQRASPTMEVI